MKSKKKKRKKNSLNKAFCRAVFQDYVNIFSETFSLQLPGEQKNEKKKKSKNQEKIFFSSIHSFFFFVKQPASFLYQISSLQVHGFSLNVVITVSTLVEQLWIVRQRGILDIL